MSALFSVARTLASGISHFKLSTSLISVDRSNALPIQEYNLPVWDYIGIGMHTVEEATTAHTLQPSVLRYIYATV